MALHFLVDLPLTARPGESVELTGAEAHHAAGVRRVRVGETVTVGDGAGAWLEGTVTAADPKLVRIEVRVRDEYPEPARRVTLIQALAKGDRDELAVQACTELGIDAIVPWQATRSVSRWSGPKVERGVQRWATIAREAAKQAHRAWLPAVEAPLSTAEVAQRCARERVLVLEPTATRRLSDVDAGEGDVSLVVGPEGGIAPEELDALTAAGAITVRLGDTVLRTSTAGPAALGVVNVAIGRW
ncbi:16S rRNA (uracil(1498)-N(3))-methyltransferase [Microbacterium arborescens]|uniref:16S rRNA (uracil(1498)-N(3))-methyltransferase n=1 Tax=Microbacterium arborescens TaxID=33883 RepID=UPI0025A11F20|nr:16S rRNA (uracil(1498)-N(3))-methyltransferase [Microbacterium arborescens]WJM14305.1 16S rRNA (uracil(1498)-N(3))-methyltransferase [Microbacterium arborescens]